MNETLALHVSHDQKSHGNRGGRSGGVRVRRKTKKPGSKGRTRVTEKSIIPNDEVNKFPPYIKKRLAALKKKEAARKPVGTKSRSRVTSKKVTKGDKPNRVPAGVKKAIKKRLKKAQADAGILKPKRSSKPQAFPALDPAKAFPKKFKQAVAAPKKKKKKASKKTQAFPALDPKKAFPRKKKARATSTLTSQEKAAGRSRLEQLARGITKPKKKAVRSGRRPRSAENQAFAKKGRGDLPSVVGGVSKRISQALKQTRKRRVTPRDRVDEQVRARQGVAPVPRKKKKRRRKQAFSVKDIMEVLNG